MNQIQSKLKIALGVLIAIGAVALILITKPVPAPMAPQGNSGPLVAEAATYAFGNVPLGGGLVRRVYAVRNAGTEPTTVTGISTSCMCTTAVITTARGTWGPFGMPGHGLLPKISATLAPDETAEVEVVYDPAAHGPSGIGPVERAVYLAHTGGDPLILSFTATVTP